MSLELHEKEQVETAINEVIVRAGCDIADGGYAVSRVGADEVDDLSAEELSREQELAKKYHLRGLGMGD